MSEEEIRDQINVIAQKIVQVEEVAKKKENYIKNKITEEYDPNISEIESKLLIEQNKLEQLIKNIDNLSLEKKNLTVLVKDLKKQYNTLKKKKQKNITNEIKAIANEKKNKMKIINQEIKTLEKKLKEKESE
ncbi:MAG: hypothetical protein ACFE85_15755 [Candidatus Hodarchaeota archaeon]